MATAPARQGKPRLPPGYPREGGERRRATKAPTRSRMAAAGELPLARTWGRRSDLSSMRPPRPSTGGLATAPEGEATSMVGMTPPTRSWPGRARTGPAGAAPNGAQRSPRHAASAGNGVRSRRCCGGPAALAPFPSRGYRTPLLPGDRAHERTCRLPPPCTDASHAAIVAPMTRSSCMVPFVALRSRRRLRAAWSLRRRRGRTLPLQPPLRRLDRWCPHPPSPLAQTTHHRTTGATGALTSARTECRWPASAPHMPSSGRRTTPQTAALRCPRHTAVAARGRADAPHGPGSSPTSPSSPHIRRRRTTRSPRSWQRRAPFAVARGSAGPMLVATDQGVPRRTAPPSR